MRNPLACRNRNNGWATCNAIIRTEAVPQVQLGPELHGYQAATKRPQAHRAEFRCGLALTSSDKRCCRDCLETRTKAARFRTITFPASLTPALPDGVSA